MTIPAPDNAAAGSPATAAPAAAAGELVIDTRIDGGPGCAMLATDAFEGLTVGGSFVLVSDHDPIGINYMLKAEQPGASDWEVLEDGPERWQVRISRIAA